MPNRTLPLLLALCLGSTGLRADAPRTVAGRWTSTPVTADLGVGQIPAMYLIGSDIAFWARSAGEWVLFHAARGERARPVYRDGQEFSEPDGIAKRIMRIADKSLSRMDRFYLACRKAPLKKARWCYVGRDPIPGIGEEAVYVYEAGQLRRILGPGDVPIAGRGPINDASVIATSSEGALVELRREGEKHQTFVLAQASGIRLLVEEGVPLAGQPGLTLDAVWSPAGLVGEAMITVANVTGAPFKRGLYRIRPGAPAEKIVAEGETPPGGRAVTSLDRFVANSDTVALVARTKGGPEGLVHHHAGVLKWGGDVENLREIVVAEHGPDVMFVHMPNGLGKPWPVVHLGSGAPREIGVFDVPARQSADPKMGQLARSASGTGLHIVGSFRAPQDARAPAAGDAQANRYVDLSDSGRIVPEPAFDTIDGRVPMIHAVHWPTPDEVLVLSSTPVEGGMLRWLKRSATAP